MRKSVLIAAAVLCLWPTETSAAASDKGAGSAEAATSFVTSIIDKFNSGDTNAWVAAQASNTQIVDEFAPYFWTGANSPKRWLDAYKQDAKANGMSGGRVDYGKPIEALSNGTNAYLVFPVTYRFAVKDTKMAEPGSLTFAMRHGAKGWLITSWTYSAAGAAAPDK